MSYIKAPNQDGVPSGKARYKFSVTIDGDRRRKQVTCYPSMIEKLHQAWERDQLLGKTRAKGPKLFESLDRFLCHVSQTRSEGTYKHYRTTVESLIKMFFTDMLVQDIRRKHIEEFVKWRRGISLWRYKKPVTLASNSTVNHCINVLSSFCNWCIIQEYIIANPCFKVRLPGGKTRQWQLTPEQIEELFNKARAQDMRFYHVVRIALSTCFRFGEIMGLRWKDIDFTHNRITLSWRRTKGKETRVIPMIPSLRELLFPMRGASDDRVIAASYNAIQMCSKRLRPTLSFAHGEDGLFRFHDLRHVAGQYLFDHGVPLDDIQRIMGHKSIATTLKHYVHFPRPDEAEKMARLDNVIPFKQASSL